MKWLRNREADRLQYEFLPSALEIIETPSSPFGRIVIWLIVGLLAIALVWAFVGKIDVIAVGQGKVVPVGNVKTIQPANGGVISSIRVSEGERVKQGQLLVELDATLATAEVKAIEKSLATAKLEREILVKTLAGEDSSQLINEADIPESTKQDLLQLAKSQSSVAEVRREFLSVSVSQAKSQLRLEQQNVRTIQGNLQAAQDRKAQLEAQIPQVSGAQQAILQSELQQVNGLIGDLQNTLMTQNQRLAQAQSGVNQASGNLDTFQAQNTSETMTSVVDQDKHIADLENSLVRARNNVELMTLKSPVDGTVLSISSHTIGGVVTTAQPLIVIVPVGTPLVVEASLQNRDIGFVREGQKVALKVDAYSFQRYGYLTGTVKSVSPDAIDDQKQGSVYKMKVTIDSNKTSKHNTIQVSPGMSVTSEIMTDKRRIVEFFLDPFTTHVDDSLKMR